MRAHQLRDAIHVDPAGLIVTLPILTEGAGVVTAPRLRRAALTAAVFVVTGSTPRSILAGKIFQEHLRPGEARCARASRMARASRRAARVSSLEPSTRSAGLGGHHAVQEKPHGVGHRQAERLENGRSLAANVFVDTDVDHLRLGHGLTLAPESPQCISIERRSSPFRKCAPRRRIPLPPETTHGDAAARRRRLGRRRPFRLDRGHRGQAVGALAGGLLDRLCSAPAARRPWAALRPLGAGLDRGAAIPRVFGRVRIAGEVIWATRFEEESRTESAGGKGGGPKVRTFSYFANFAVGLCEGPIARVGRVWANGKLLDLTRVTMRVHDGDETQDVDSLILARQGRRRPIAGSPTSCSSGCRWRPSATRCRSSPSRSSAPWDGWSA